MGFVLTLLYIAMTVLSPAELFPELEPYRIMLWLGAAALLASVARLRTLSVVLILIALYFVIQGIIAFHTAAGPNPYTKFQPVYDADGDRAGYLRIRACWALATMALIPVLTAAVYATVRMRSL